MERSRSPDVPDFEMEQPRTPKAKGTPQPVTPAKSDITFPDDDPELKQKVRSTVHVTQDALLGKVRYVW